MKITVAELRVLCDKLFSHLDANGKTSIDIEQDYYWFVPAELRYSPYQEPKTLTLGQLTDDWRELSKIIDDQVDPVNYALVWLSSVLRIIGEKTPG